MRRIRRENPKRYKSSSSTILHTDETSPDVIARINKFPERNSTVFLTDDMFLEDGIIKKRDVVYVLSYKSPGKNIPEGTGWVNKVEKCKNRSTTILVKLYVDVFLYH